MSESPGLLRPPWGRAGAVRVASTTRLGGVGAPPFATLNLGERAGDDPATVAANRGRLRRALALPAEPSWLAQVHGSRAARAAAGAGPVEADAAWSDEPGVVCAVLTADCLPVVLADERARCVAVAHAGWRGLAAGVLESCVASLPVAAGELRAWLGPAIGPAAFEVGDEVHSAFLATDAGAGVAFRRGHEGRWLCDLYTLARRRLRAAGIGRIEGGGWCTLQQPRLFFSHRRDGPSTGRMATLAWLASD